MSNINRRLIRIILVLPAVCLLASAAVASVELPSTVSKSLVDLYPNAKVLTANIDEDGHYLIDLKVNENETWVGLDSG